MNKVAIVAVLVVFFVGLVAANKLPNKKLHHHHHDGEFEHPHHIGHLEGHHGGFGMGHGHGLGLGHGHGHGHGFGLGGHGLGRNSFVHFSDEELLDELEQRKFRHHSKNFGKGRFGGKRGGFGRKSGHGGLGGAGGAGAIGGIGASESSTGAIGASNHLGSHKLAEEAGGHILGNKASIHAGHNDFDQDEGSNLHKHEVINSDKTIIRDKTSGIKDVDANRHSNIHSDSAEFGADKEELIAGGHRGRFESSNEADQRFGASGSQKADVIAGGAAGAAGLGGAGGSL